jgi:hypothetical protein
MYNNFWPAYIMKYPILGELIASHSYTSREEAFKNATELANAASWRHGENWLEDPSDRLPTR